MNQFTGYAKYYDDMYTQKPYEHEVDQLEAFWASHSDHPIKTILSLGCGTGTYEIILAKRGYTVTGVDLSQDMLDQAKVKITDANVGDNITLLQGDMKETKVYGQFDAVIMMFNIAGYVHTTVDLTAVIKNVASNLKTGGTFIYDAWYDQAVIADPPTDRTKVIEKDVKTITRITRGLLDLPNKLVKISFDVTKVENGVKNQHVTEDHPMRYWGLDETKSAIEAGGLKLVTTTSFVDTKNNVSLSEWDMFVVAKKA